MEQNEIQELADNRAITIRDGGMVTLSQGDSLPSPPLERPSCPTCESEATAMTPAYVYALGRIEARFPRLSVEKEFAQATGQTDTAGKTDQQTFHALLSRRENRYLVKQLCWVL